MNYLQAMHKIRGALDCLGWDKSINDIDLKIKWRSKQIGNDFVTFYFKPQSIYFVKNNNPIRHFKDARSLHLDDIKFLSVLSKATTIEQRLLERTY